MEATVCKTLSEKERMNDLLSSEKYLTAVYNTYCCETATASLKSTLMSILEDEHRIGGEIFQEMNNRGWYPVEKAEENKITSAKMQFAQSVSR